MPPTKPLKKGVATKTKAATSVTGETPLENLKLKRCTEENHALSAQNGILFSQIREALDKTEQLKRDHRDIYESQRSQFLNLKRASEAKELQFQAETAEFRQQLLKQAEDIRALQVLAKDNEVDKTDEICKLTTQINVTANVTEKHMELVIEKLLVYVKKFDHMVYGGDVSKTTKTNSRSRLKQLENWIVDARHFRNQSNETASTSNPTINIS